MTAETVEDTNLRMSCKTDDRFTKGMIHLAEIEIDLTRFCDLIGGYLYPTNQVLKIGFDFAKSLANQQQRSAFGEPLTADPVATKQTLGYTLKKHDKTPSSPSASYCRRLRIIYLLK
jgi:hypothetical protein